jgi:hypothetical protein
MRGEVPHIVDLALERAEGIYRKTQAFKHVQSILPVTRRFIFGPEASEFLGHFIRECGDLIVEQAEFALAPFQNTYLQINIDLTHRALGAATTHDLFKDKGYGADVDVGYLLSGERVYTFAAGRNGDKAFMSPIVLNRNTPQKGPVLSRLDGEYPEWRSTPLPQQDETVRAMYLFGSTLNRYLTDFDDIIANVEAARAANDRALFDFHLSQGMDFAEARILATVNRHKPIRDLVNNTSVNTAWGKPAHAVDILYGGMGELRTILAALLILNQPHSNVRFAEMKAQRGFWRGKPRAYAKHNVVHIDIDGLKNLRKRFLTGSRETPRAHEVRGHFLNYNKHQCDHAWVQAIDNSKRWTCSTCGQLRVWREAYERGDASKGYVTKHYQADAH